MTAKKNTGRDGSFDPSTASGQADLSAVAGKARAGKAAEIGMIEKGGLVLLVEDEQSVRKMVSTMLAHLGFTVLPAKNGAEAVEMLRRHIDDIRCVLCDLTMPGMDGWETLAALRKLSQGIPVVLASGHDEAQVMEGDHPEQPHVFLSKPYSLDGIRDAIHRATAKKAEDV